MVLIYASPSAWLPVRETKEMKIKNEMKMKKWNEKLGLTDMIFAHQFSVMKLVLHEEWKAILIKQK